MFPGRSSTSPRRSSDDTCADAASIRATKCPPLVVDTLAHLSVHDRRRSPISKGGEDQTLTNVRLALPFQHASTDVRGGDDAGPFTRRAAGHRRSAVHGERDHSAWSAQRKTTSGKGDGRHPGAEGARRRLRASNDLAGPCPHGAWRRASVGGSSRRRYRRWSAEEKCSICRETRAPGVSVAQVARRHALMPT